ncbi:hypothetical protein ES703_100129 [subsurface metagenome]
METVLNVKKSIPVFISYFTQLTADINELYAIMEEERLVVQRKSNTLPKIEYVKVKYKR